MSDIGKIIERREQWVEQWQSRVPELLIADLRALISTAKASQQALQVLKAAQRFGTINEWDGEILSARPVTDGEWTRSDVLDDAIKILEGRQ